MPNHLANENSPYLLQHASNPVDWYPWGEEALERARRENKPIFLSIGYAACHWCHVMERESFENQETAELLNAKFIAVKVDREQRPDLDNIYMQATQSLTGSGGWPMSVFLTPDLQPFYAGTYFPPVRRHNLPAFADVLASIAEAWQEKPAEIRHLGAQVIAQVQASMLPQAREALSPSLLDDAAALLMASYDHEYGGWGRAPKFPQPMLIDFLMQRAAGSQNSDTAASDIAWHALKAMARGGMYDVVGGGFSRYSTDNYWRVPHFEKMLYDNAQLALAYLHAWQVTRDSFYKEIVINTLNFVTREMRDSLGGFYSSLDADSEGSEGKFYVWSKDEIREALGDNALFELFLAAYGITERGNWEGRTVLQRTLDDVSLAAHFKTDTSQLRMLLRDGHTRLRRWRTTRTRPATDDKVLCGWNGLTLRAFAQASRFLEDQEEARAYLEVATRNAEFLLSEMQPSGQLRRTWHRGAVGRQVFLEDHAALVLGLLDLYQSSFDNRWFVAAQDLAERVIAGFSDPHAGFFDTPSDADPLPVRPKDLQDSAVPSGNALACEALLKLAALGGDARLRELAQQSLNLVGARAARYPAAFGHWLSAVVFDMSGEQQLAIVYPPFTDPGALLTVANASYRPNLVVAASEYPPPPVAPNLLVDRPLRDGKPTAYVCHAFTCRLPVTTPQELQDEL